MAGTTDELSITSLHASKVEALTFDAAHDVVRPGVIKQKVELQILPTRTILTPIATKHQGLHPDASCLNCAITDHDRLFHGCALPAQHQATATTLEMGVTKMLPVESSPATAILSPLA